MPNVKKSCSHSPIVRITRLISGSLRDRCHSRPAARPDRGAASTQVLSKRFVKTIRVDRVDVCTWCFFVARISQVSCPCMVPGWGDRDSVVFSRIGHVSVAPFGLVSRRVGTVETKSFLESLCRCATSCPAKIALEFECRDWKKIESWAMAEASAGRITAPCLAILAEVPVATLRWTRAGHVPANPEIVAKDKRGMLVSPLPDFGRFQRSPVASISRIPHIIPIRARMVRPSAEHPQMISKHGG